MPTRTADPAGFPLRPVVAPGAVAVPAEVPGDGPTMNIQNATAVGFSRTVARAAVPGLHPPPGCRRPPLPPCVSPPASPHGTCPGRLPYGAAGGFQRR